MYKGKKEKSVPFHPTLLFFPTYIKTNFSLKFRKLDMDYDAIDYKNIIKIYFSIYIKSVKNNI